MSNKLIADLMSFRARMVADNRTQVMFEGDFDTIDQVIATLRKAYQAAINNKGDYKEYSQDDAPANYQHAEAFAWASGAMHGYVEGYQAAAPIGNVAEALEKAASICEQSKYQQSIAGQDVSASIAKDIRALIPTQADHE
jgi:hypothetical protein